MTYTRTTASGAPLLPAELGRCSATELVEIIGQIDGELLRLHQEPDGELRSLDATEEQLFDDLILTRRAAEDHLKIRRAFARGSESRNMERAYQGLDRHRPTTRQPSGTGPYFNRSASAIDGSDALQLSDQEARDRALTALENRFGTEHLTTESFDHVDNLIRRDDINVQGAHVARRILLTENQDYRSAFSRLVTESQPLLTAEEIMAVRNFQDWERTESRAMSEGVTTAGGFGVPTFIDPTITLTGQEVNNPYQRMARVESVTTNVWKGINSAGVTWSFDAEAAEVSDDSPVLAQPTATVFMARGFVPYSIEVGQDYPGLAEELARILAGGYVDLEINKLTNGSGTGEPKGIVTALSGNAAVRVKVATAGTFVVNDLYNVWEQLPIRFRSRANWFSSTSVQDKVRGFGATFGSNFTVDLSRPTLPFLFGSPYELSDYMAASTTSTANVPVAIVGDFQNFVVARRAGMSIEPVRHLFGLTNNRPTGERGAFAWARIGSTTVTDLGFRMLTNVT